MSPEARAELRWSRKVRRESRERDRQFSREDRGFCVGVALGLAAVILAVGLYKVLAP